MVRTAADLESVSLAVFSAPGKLIPGDIRTPSCVVTSAQCLCLASRPCLCSHPAISIWPLVARSTPCVRPQHPTLHRHSLIR